MLLCSVNNGHAWRLAQVRMPCGVYQLAENQAQSKIWEKKAVNWGVCSLPLK